MGLFKKESSEEIAKIFSKNDIKIFTKDGIEEVPAKVVNISADDYPNINTENAIERANLVDEPTVIGYKAMNKDMTCRGFQYEIGHTYEMSPDKVELCNSGFHYCKKFDEVFNFYDVFQCRVFKIKAVKYKSRDDIYSYSPYNFNMNPLYGGDKEVTYKITILQEISEEDIYKAFLRKFVNKESKRDFFYNDDGTCIMNFEKFERLRQGSCDWNKYFERVQKNKLEETLNKLDGIFTDTMTAVIKQEILCSYNSNPVEHITSIKHKVNKIIGLSENTESMDMLMYLTMKTLT